MSHSRVSTISGGAEIQDPSAERIRHGRTTRAKRLDTLKWSVAVSWRPFVTVILAFWVLWYLAYTLFDFMEMPKVAASTLLPRTIIAVAGALISCGIAAALESARSRPIAARAFAAIGLALLATAVHLIITHRVWATFLPDERPSSPLAVAYTLDFIIRFWFFATITAIILAMSYVRDIRDRETQITALQALAHSAHIRALRNQLNPHFLFNALNSVAALLSRGDSREAENMTENLADFLRATLALDAQRLIELGEELRLQNLYLDVEKVRFPDRLKVEIDVPQEAQRALVPSLIMQPLVENSIKYAVARSTAPVTLRIAARISGSDLELLVEDNGGNAEPAASMGERVGLLNVQERIVAHYGDAASFESGRTSGAGFRNVVRVPVTYP